MMRSLSHRRQSGVTHTVEKRVLERAIHPAYFPSMSPADLAARDCRNRDECKARYLGAVRPMLPAELGKLRAWTRTANELMRRHRHARALERLFEGCEWKFCKVSDEVEGGFPHTHGDIIILPQHMFSSSSSSSSAVVKTLIHELVHVAQRKNRSLCERLYVDFWNLRPRDIAAVPRELAGRIRSNPDVGVRHVLWTSAETRYGCVQLYTRELPRSLSDSEARLIMDSSAVETGTCAYEHPNEAMAYMLADTVAGDRSRHDGPGGDDTMFSAAALERWLAWLGGSPPSSPPSPPRSVVVPPLTAE